MSNRREIIDHWSFNDVYGHKGAMPTLDGERFFMKNLMNIAAADGILSDEERQWVIDYALACRYTETYEAGLNTEIFQKLSADPGADGYTPEEEYEAIYTFAKNMGADDKRIQDVRLLYEDDLKLRQKRAQILVPQGLETSWAEFKKAQ